MLLCNITCQGDRLQFEVIFVSVGLVVIVLCAVISFGTFEQTREILGVFV